MLITAENSVVAIEYEVKELGSEEVIDTNKVTGQPLEFITGKSHIIPGLENALVGMKKDESGDMLVNAVDAYGEVHQEAIETLPIDQFEGVELKEGLVLYGQGPEGQQVQVTVKSFNDENVTIDYNHPLAGKNLMFSVTILDCREATADEIASGQVGGASAGGSCGSHGQDDGCGCSH